ncbi:hypothetical protein NP493_173g03000 [Ridgeia piscesae]|uniref:Sugar phosphate transporter domain-containing protein n=1 Tax=Ridgeia piscesae TaxID=27915 RepID=A0AAD9UFA0_RIDPI|nr:hypothetical protein NP493_173g03000 [Ridgeia piscesae]
MIDRMPRTREHVQLTILSDEKLTAGNNRASPYIPKRKLKSRSKSNLYSMESLLTKSLKIAGAVAAYWTVSIFLVFINKYLLSDKDLKLDAVLFVTWFQCVVSVLLCGILATVAKLAPNLISFPEFKINLHTAREVLPLSIVFVSMISFNNLCLKFVGVAFYYVGRSLTTVFNVMLTRAILKQSTSWSAIGCCAVIVFGFMLGVDQEGAAGSLSIRGVLFGVCASLSVALYSIFIKKALPAVDDNIWRLTLYNNFNAVILFLPLMVVTGDISAVIAFPKIDSLSFWFYMVIGGTLGFAIGYVTGLQIQVTSPLTHNISGTAKACAQTVIATSYYHDVKPMLWWTSNFVVLFGSAAYAQVRRSEMKQKHDSDMKSLENATEAREQLLKNGSTPPLKITS